ncbi:hypothetical protein IMX26_13470 [Clostridium sp. 'deep sea']|uniref:hypothetical protein n=1 Tax=Clostridium sp. 'deep sea' TaxID=2779445 RepID=UPI0018968573|nr:hypothetical protein [Clostridium sp. 'deep sea']QOR34487.1 hypothetical protein IMX26_13470 [Clostridium sp. 'deep sea']
MKLVEITRKRKLPYAGSVMVELGQQVSNTDLVAQMNYFPGLVKKLNVAKSLSINPQKLIDVICVEQGKLVKEGELIAFNSRWHRAQFMKAPQSGIIGMISRHLGIVYLRKLIKYNTNTYEVFNIEQLLDSNSRFAKKSILVNVGDSVSPGQIIANLMYSKGRFKIKYVTTNLFGTVVEIKNNIITIKNSQKSPKKYAYLSGTVTEIEPNWSVTIKSEAYKLTGVYGLGGEISGQLRIIKSPKLTVEQLTEQDKSKIILTQGFITKAVLLKSKEIGVAAIIASSCNLATLREYAGKNFIPGITGSEDITTGVVLLKGFNISELNKEVFSELQNYNNCECSINGTTHIRAGAIRPEILIFPK